VRLEHAENISGLCQIFSCLRQHGYSIAEEANYCNRLEPSQCCVPRWNPWSFVGVLGIAGSFSNIAPPDIYKLNTSVE
jgi:hypothetical protein